MAGPDRLPRLRGDEPALVKGPADVNLAVVPVDVPALEGEEFAAPHPGQDRGEEERVELHRDMVQELVDLRRRQEVHPLQVRPRFPELVGGVVLEIAILDGVLNDLVEDGQDVPDSLG